MHVGNVLTNLLDYDGPNKCPGLEIENLNVSFLTPRKDSIAHNREGQDRAMITFKGMLWYRTGGGARPYLV